ncbi:hypothetical protein L7F22_047837 [Adiantum nelumboides]|nr:hypothetical protein [Adiantum nelumboides]
MVSSPASSLSIAGGGGRSFASMASPRSLLSPRPLQPGLSSPVGSGNGRRTSSGRYLPVSQDDNEQGEEVTSQFHYTVHIPPTPDNRPLLFCTPNTQQQQQQLADDGASAIPAVPIQSRQEFVSNTLFSGGFQSLTRGHVMEKMVESESGNPDTEDCAKGPSVCAIVGCDGKVITDETGQDVAPCECGFSICRDCYIEALESGGICRGCKHMYKVCDPDRQGRRRHGDEDDDEEEESDQFHMPPLSKEQALEKRLSLLRSSKNNNPPLLMGKHVSEFDHARWLFETKGTYGYGNALWPKDGAYLKGGGSAPPDFDKGRRRPLSRKKCISAGIISPYRILVVFRLVALCLFLTWRIRHPNKDAMWLWGMSIVCEIWFAFSWVLDQVPKLAPVNRTTDLSVLSEKFERPSASNPKGRSDLPGMDIYVSTADPEKEPPLVTANTILSILAVQYPVEKLACYLSDDGGALLSFEALAEAASFARLWVPFCRKHNIEPRNPEAYFQSKGDPTRNKVRTDFVRDRRRIKREYDEFKIRINGLPESIRRRSDAFNAHEEIRAKRAQVELGADPTEQVKFEKATWMADGTHWPGTWDAPTKDHSRGDHAGVIQVMLTPATSDPVYGNAEDILLDTTGVDIRLPMLVYVSREKRPGYDHNKKAGAMNALVRTSAIMSNGPFILNLDCDHYIYNSLALREAMCFMMDRGGDRICYVQFPQRFEGVDPNDRYANHNTVFFDVNMRALDGVQGPMYVGTGCVFRRIALYGFDPPRTTENSGCCGRRKMKVKCKRWLPGRKIAAEQEEEETEDIEAQLLPRKFGSSTTLAASIPVAELEARPLADYAGNTNGRPSGLLTSAREPLDAGTVAEAINVISCWYEDKTEWGLSVGWIYGSVTEDVVTGYRMHDRGWRSVYCVTKRDAFRGTAPINLTDRLHQVLRWATGSVEIFFSRNNALFGSRRLKPLQRVAYLNVGLYPFTSIFLIVYCFLPALSLVTNQFIVQSLGLTFLVFLLSITVSMCLLALLEIKWSGITLHDWWRNEQFWLTGGTSAHLVAVMQGLLKVIAGVDINFTLTAKSATGDDAVDEFAELYEVRWSALMIPPLTIIMTNFIAIAIAIGRTVYNRYPDWSKLLGGVFFSVWVLAHLYPFSKGLMGRKRRTPTIVFVWSGLLAIIISLMWVSISSPPTSGGGLQIQPFQFP